MKLPPTLHGKLCLVYYVYITHTVYYVCITPTVYYFYDLPPAIRASITLTCPFPHAKCHGVVPRLLVAERSAPVIQSSQWISHIECILQYVICM